MDALTLSNLQAALTTRVFGREAVVLQRTESTNDVAKAMVRRGAPEGALVLAEEQTAGRGRMGRRWVAPAGTCLLCSLLFRPDLPPERVQQLTMLCALAAADAVAQVTSLLPALKWPNDLIVVREREGQVQWRKLAGVLTETGGAGDRLTFAIVGLGLNANVPPAVLSELSPDATSILAETGQPVDRVTLLATLLAGVERRYEALRRGASPHAEWSTRLATLGQPVTATFPDRALAGIAEAVDPDGALLLRTPDGVLHRLLAADVTLSTR